MVTMDVNQLQANIVARFEDKLRELGQLPLFEAIQTDDVEFIRNQLQNEGLDPQTQLISVSLLSCAVDTGSLRVAKVLTEFGADPNFGGKLARIPLYVAARRAGHPFLEMMQLLLDAGASINMKYINGNTPLLEAVCRNDLGKCQLLIRAGADVLATNNGGDTALHMAAIRGNGEIVKELLKAGVPVDISKKEGLKKKLDTGFQALHATTYGLDGGHDRVAAILLEAGADPDAPMNNGRTPLHLCAMKNSHRVAKVLLAHNCVVDPISIENNEHKTPLMKVIDTTDATHNDATLLRMLIEAGADLNTTDRWGMTPLSTAVFTGCPDFAEILIRAGCDMGVVSKSGMTALRASITQHRPKLTRMLIQAGCKIDVSTRNTVITNLTLTIHRCPRFLYWFVHTMDNPRTLMEISRSRIRQAIGVHAESKIQKLPIPGKIKDYVGLCDIEEIEEDAAVGKVSAGFYETQRHWPGLF